MTGFCGVVNSIDCKEGKLRCALWRMMDPEAESDPLRHMNGSWRESIYPHKVLALTIQPFVSEVPLVWVDIQIHLRSSPPKQTS